MVLSTSNLSSLTGPPSPTPPDLTAAERATRRFAVQGNAILTGGGGALALVNARALLEHGLSGLALFDLDFSSMADQIASLSRDFPQARILSICGDVTDPVQVERAVAQSTEELGPVSILCCFAGVVGCMHALDIAPDEWKRTLEINTTGSFLCAQAFARALIPTKTRGSILLIASISAHRTNYPQPQASYNTSKAALVSLKSSLATEWARYGIRVNSISPGYMDTVLNAGPGLAAAREVWQSRCPWGRMGAPEELTGAVVMLCGRAGGYITGADFVIDGGQMCIWVDTDLAIVHLIFGIHSSRLRRVSEHARTSTEKEWGFSEIDIKILVANLWSNGS